MLMLASAILPDGFSLPPLQYLLALFVCLGVVLAALWRLRPRIDDRTILAFVPWIAAGGAFHALYQLNVYPDVVAPLFGSAAVYATVTAIAGAVWIAVTVVAPRDGSARILGGTGLLALAVAIGVGAFRASLDGPLALWSLVSLVAALILTAITWLFLDRTAPESVSVASWTGLVVVFGHALDAASTAVGYDIIGVHERTPLSRLLLETAAGLPTAEYVGAGWLFVLVKLVLAGGIVVLFREYLRDSPGEARLLLTFIAAVGLGPGAHNVVLFAFTG